jgi:hypothetical protein
MGVSLQQSQRLAVRQQQSAPVVECIRQWALVQRAAPGSAFRKALEYMLKLWDGLSVFLSSPVVLIDNNHVERQMRDMHQHPTLNRTPMRPIRPQQGVHPSYTSKASGFSL